VTVPDVVVTPPAGAPAVFDLPAAVPDVVPESVVLMQPNEAPATVVTIDEGTWQVQPTTGEVVFTPSPTLVGDPAPITFAAERTDGSAVTGRLVVDYVAAAAGPVPTQAPAAGADAAASSGALAFTGSDAGTTSAAALIGAAALLAGLGLTLAGRRRLRH
jgi:CshA-type fibril repeat protein